MITFLESFLSTICESHATSSNGMETCACYSTLFQDVVTMFLSKMLLSLVVGELPTARTMRILRRWWNAFGRKCWRCALGVMEKQPALFAMGCRQAQNLLLSVRHQVWHE